MDETLGEQFLSDLEPAPDDLMVSVLWDPRGVLWSIAVIMLNYLTPILYVSLTDSCISISFHHLFV